ncbi:integrase catalytic domain-containing protein [Trichonephila clavipes]|nr:integrase catalytic domain-containing protein [Trichonephila clavipes]
MYTVLCDCVSLINSRPLTYVTDDVEDLKPLTPAMFLKDREVGVPELDQIDENKLNKRLVYQNRIQNDLRKRFRVEYLGQLRETRNIKGENTLSEGDIVLEQVNTSRQKPETVFLSLAGHQQAPETSLMQPCSNVSDGEAGVEPRLETLELPDVLTSDGELQQPGPQRSRYGRLLKPRKGLNDSC